MVAFARIAPIALQLFKMVAGDVAVNERPRISAATPASAPCA
jgi:hypothetical protein